MKIISVRNKGWSWLSKGVVQAKGYVFDRSEDFCRDEDLVDVFSGICDEAQFYNRLCDVNGSFAVILNTDHHLFAAVDSVRSIPLFYAMKHNELLLGDDVLAIQKELGRQEIDPIAKEEFLRFGYTVGSDTLDPRIKQIEAGELLIYDKSSSAISNQIYFSHAHRNYTEKSQEVLIEELDQITTRWAQRLIQSAQGRTIVVPLSGGYDSRYIVCALKREGYKNVICYSYGVSDSYEHHIAKKVATTLGFPIHIIDYSQKSWKTLLESPRFLEYCRFASQQNSVPCVQELLAREVLSKTNIIPSNSIFVPGYCGDVQGGSYVPKVTRSFKAQSILAKGIDRYIFQNLFANRASLVSTEIEQAVLARINTYTSHYRSGEMQDFCSVLEDWITRNQLTKYIINTVRTHELYGDEWRLPLWDKELISWWYKIPLKYRVNSALFHKFLFERIFDPADVCFRKPRRQGRLNQLAQTWLPDGAIPIIRAAYKATFRKTVKSVTLEPVDLDGFNYVSSFLLEQLSDDYNKDDFSNISGVVATWCIEHEHR